MTQNFLDAVIASPLTPPALAFIEGNYPTLLALGQDAVTDVLAKIKAGDKQAALIALELRLTDPDVIIAFENQNAKDLLASVAAREKFIGELETFAEELLPTLVTLGVKVATGGIGAL